MQFINPANRIPTEQMIELLMDCHERELMRLPAFEASTTCHSAGLIRRNFLSTIMCNYKDRVYIGLRTTQHGRDFLDRYCQIL